MPRRGAARDAPQCAHIYEGELVALTDSLIPDLRRVARTEHAATFYIGNGHARVGGCNLPMLSPLVTGYWCPPQGVSAMAGGDMATGLGARWM